MRYGEETVTLKSTLTIVDISFKGRERLDVACRWRRLDLGVERAMGAKVLCWKGHFARTSYDAGEPSVFERLLFLIQYRSQSQFYLARERFFVIHSGK